MGSPGTVPAREVDRGAAAELPPNQAKIQPGEAGGQKLPLVTHNPELVKWQNRLLPLMSGFVIALALAFFVLSTRTLGHVNEFVETEHGELRQQINAIISAKQPDTSDDVVRRGLLMLEAEALDRRYHQASALLMSRVWAKNLAFLTGVIMAFIGAIFILGKLSETPSAVQGGGSGWNVSITSASPGILLAFFGTTLVALSIVIHEKIDVQDGTAYLHSVMVQNAAPDGSASSAPGAVDHSITDKIKALSGHPSAPSTQKK